MAAGDHTTVSVRLSKAEYAQLARRAAADDRRLGGMARQYLYARKRGSVKAVPGPTDIVVTVPVLKAAKKDLGHDAVECGLMLGVYCRAIVVAALKSKPKGGA